MRLEYCAAASGELPILVGCMMHVLNSILANIALASTRIGRCVSLTKHNLVFISMHLPHTETML